MPRVIIFLNDFQKDQSLTYFNEGKDMKAIAHIFNVISKAVSNSLIKSNDH